MPNQYCMPWSTKFCYAFEFRQHKNVFFVYSQAATAADDSDRMRKVFESRALQDEDRMSKLEEELKDARYNIDHDLVALLIKIMFPS